METYINQRIAELKQEQEYLSKTAQDFTFLDLRLKSRRNKGEVFTKEHPDVLELLRLGNIIHWNGDDKGKFNYSSIQRSIEELRLALVYYKIEDFFPFKRRVFINESIVSWNRKIEYFKALLEYAENEGDRNNLIEDLSNAEGMLQAYMTALDNLVKF